MEITEDTLYSEIGRQVVRARMLEASLRQTITENRRLTQRVEQLELTGAEADDGLPD